MTIFSSDQKVGTAASEQCRLDDLKRLLPLWPHEIADRSVPGRQRLIARLERALRAERRRARANHWAYDVARHSALVRILAEERDALARSLKLARAPSLSEPKLKL